MNRFLFVEGCNQLSCRYNLYRQAITLLPFRIGGCAAFPLIDILVRTMDFSVRIAFAYVIGFTVAVNAEYSSTALSSILFSMKANSVLLPSRTCDLSGMSLAIK